MRHHLYAGALAALLGLAALLTRQMAGGSAAWALAAGGLVPAVVSWVSLALLLDGSRPLSAQTHQRDMLINFFAKVLLIGGWTVAVVLATTLPRTVFVASLLINFMAWHLLEAWAYQHRLIAGRLGTGSAAG